MWNAEEFFNFLKKNPCGGTFWARADKKMVRHIRTFYPNKETVIAVMTEKMIFRGKNDSKVELFVGSPENIAVEEFLEPGKNREFTEKLMASNILKLVREDLRPAAQDFIAISDKTYPYYTW